MNPVRMKTTPYNEGGIIFIEPRDCPLRRSPKEVSCCGFTRSGGFVHKCNFSKEVTTDYADCDHPNQGIMMIDERLDW